MPVLPVSQRNYEYLKRKFPSADESFIRERVKNIQWPINRKARVCEVTVNSSCNNRCLFCYNAPEDFGAFPEPEINLIYRTLYEGRKKGSWIAAIIGGEPSLRKDIGKIATFARKAGYECVKICTNGLKLSDKSYVRHLAESGFNMFDISIHGHNSMVHDKLVNKKGAFKKVMRAIENVREMGQEVGTNQVLNALNYRNFPEFFRMAYLNLGINYYNIIYAHYRGMMSKNLQSLKISISRAAAKVYEGLKLLTEYKMPAFSRMLVNFPPCLFPDCMDIIADWELDEESGDPLLLPDGKTVNMATMKNKQTVKLPVCRRCSVGKVCRGIDREYVEIFGTSEFVPIKKRRKNVVKTIF